jgi:RpiB/LacA/LacB family sugar-phosphate isomerase
MKIFIGADHRGYQLKKEIVDLLTRLGHSVKDLGSYDEESCDYPPIACKVAMATAKSKSGRGILVCMTGIGHSIAANKIPGAFAALCYNKEAAALSRQHNNSNVLVLGAKFVSNQEIKEIISTWLDSKFEGGRHLRRVKQIKEIEKKGKCG